MRIHSLIAMLGLLSLVGTASQAQDRMPTVTAVRHAIERSLPSWKDRAWPGLGSAVACRAIRSRSCRGATTRQGGAASPWMTGKCRNGRTGP